MWCEKAAPDLSAWIDGELPKARADEVRAHVRACVACRGEVERIKRVDDSFRSLPSPPALPALRRRLEAGVRRIRRRRRFTPLLPAAALVFVALVLRFTYMPESKPGQPPPVLDREAALVESLELELASLRLTLAADVPDRALQDSLKTRFDALDQRIEKLRLNRAR